MKVVQVWECPECPNRYTASIPVTYVLCNKTESHKSRTNKVMTLIEGSAREKKAKSTIRAAKGRSK